MGFYSFLTSDTKESIANIHSERPAKTVYMLLPHGEKPVKETSYDGYGRFGGIDAMEQLARMNINDKNLQNLNFEIRDIGIALYCGFKLFKDQLDNYYCFTKAAKLIAKCFLGIDAYIVKYDDKITINDELITIREHLENKNIVTLTAPNPMYPLKFSFNEYAKYNDLQAAAQCPYQGFFYPTDEDDDEAERYGR